MRRFARTYVTSSDSNLANDRFAIAPKIANLTPGSVPTDAIDVVIAPGLFAGTTDKLNSIVSEYKSEFVTLSSNEGCDSGVTMRVPKSFPSALYDALKIDSRSCHRETSLMLAVLEGLVNSKNEHVVTLPRGFWKQMGRAFRELNANETSLNVQVAAARAIAFPVSADIQALPSTKMILAANEVYERERNQDNIIDKAFKDTYIDYIRPSDDLPVIFDRVLRDMPASLGVDSVKPPTQLVEISPSNDSEAQQLFDLDDLSSPYGDVYKRLKNLFSYKTLCTPIGELRLMVRNSSNALTIQYCEWAPLTTGDSPTKTVTAYQSWTIAATGIDINKSIIDQDWAVKGTTVAGYKNKSITTLPWINVTDIDNHLEATSYANDRVFQGLSGKMYTGVEVIALSDALSGLWSKIKNINFPSPAQLDTGLNIVATGLGVIGQLTGSGGCVKASNVLNAVKEGLGNLLPTLNGAAGTLPDARASIEKNALTVLPALIDAGKNVFEAITTPTQDLRTHVGSYKKLIEQNFARVADVDASAKKMIV